MNDREVFHFPLWNISSYACVLYHHWPLENVMVNYWVTFIKQQSLALKSLHAIVIKNCEQYNNYEKTSIDAVFITIRCHW